MSNFVKSSEYCVHIYAKFGYFLQGNNAPNAIWSSLLPRSTHKYSIEIYFLFFELLFYLIRILEL
jgi:hypothetical protein